MAKTWYPVIDYIECSECGTCVAKCPHGVYDKAKFPSPVVTDPNSCIDHCHGCGTWCPQGAITYVGDDTGWCPPNGKTSMVESCCDGTVKSDSCCGTADAAGSCCGGPVKSDSCCGGDETAKIRKALDVDFLYLDLNTCERCKATDSTLDEAVDELSGVLDTLGYRLKVHKLNITSPEMAENYSFLSSPTIRVNGRDICMEVIENHCGDCGDICGDSIDCRVFVYDGKEYDQPPKAMIVDGILKAIYAPQPPVLEKPYSLPENLRTFFNGIQSSCCDKACSCQEGCQ